MDNTQSILQGASQAAAQQTQDFLNPTQNNSSSILSGIGNLNQPQATQTPVAQETGNWITRLLPTLGGIAAPLLGSALLAPLTGGASLLGGVALAGAGSGLGKGVENVVEGQKDVSKDILPSVLEGGAGQLIGEGIGKALGGVGKVVGGIGEKGLAQEAATTAADEGVKAAQTANNVWQDVAKGVKKASDLGATQKLATKLGVDSNSFTQLAQTGDTATSILNDQLNNILQKSGAVDATGVNDIIKSAINDRSGLLGSADLIAKSKGALGVPNTPAAKLLGQLENITAGVANRSEADPLAYREMVSKIGSLIPDAKPSVTAATGAIDPVQKATYNTLTDVYGKLKGLLYNRPEVDQGVTDLIGNLRAADVGGNELLAQHLNDVLTSSKSGQDLVDSLKSFTNMNKLGNAGIESLKNPATAASVRLAKMELPQEASAIPGGLVSQTVANNPHPLINLAGKALTIGSRGGVPGKAAVGLGGLLERIAPLTGSVTGETIANAPNYVAPAGAGTQIGQNMQPGQLPIGSSGNATQDIMNSQSPVALPLQEMLRLQQYGGGYNVPSEMAAIAPMAATSLGQMTKANAAQSQLSQLIDLYNKAGGAQGPIGGLLAQLGGAITGGPAAQYGKEASQVTALINQLTGANVGAPTLGMDQGAAQSVLAQLQQALASYGGAGGVSAL